MNEPTFRLNTADLIMITHALGAFLGKHKAQRLPQNIEHADRLRQIIGGFDVAILRRTSPSTATRLPTRSEWEAMGFDVPAELCSDPHPRPSAPICG